ncbi:MAG: hypothetical protein EXR21_03230 [Flavobacteriaceae bacterium]|nr:hypothetical protein [Flavobacteriaceae bacterium]
MLKIFLPSLRGLSRKPAHTKVVEARSNLQLLTFLFLLLPTLLSAQTDTTCASQGESGYKACLLPKEAGWIKPAANIASRKGAVLYIKLLSGKKLAFANELYNPDSQAVDTSRTYIFIKSHKNKYATVLRIARDGNTFLLIDLANGEQKGFDGLPQFSPSMNRILCVSGSQHSPFSPEIATVWKRSGKAWRQEYKSEPKALEGYGTGKWTSDSRITLRKMDWGKSSGGKPQEAETVLLYEFEEWRRVGK